MKYANPLVVRSAITTIVLWAIVVSLIPAYRKMTWTPEGRFDFFVRKKFDPQLKEALGTERFVTNARCGKVSAESNIISFYLINGASPYQQVTEYLVFYKFKDSRWKFDSLVHSTPLFIGIASIPLSDPINAQNHAGAKKQDLLVDDSPETKFGQLLRSSEDY